MTINDYIWPSITLYDIYDYVWLCISVYDYVWICVTMYDCVWLCKAMYDYI